MVNLLFRGVMLAEYASDLSSGAYAWVKHVSQTKNPEECLKNFLPLHEMHSILRYIIIVKS